MIKFKVVKIIDLNKKYAGYIKSIRKEFLGQDNQGNINYEQFKCVHFSKQS